MKPARVIWATYLSMVVVQTVGSIDGKHRLPAPKQFALISVLWGTFFLAAETNLRATAARLSVLVLLAGMVLGPFGRTLVNFLQTILHTFATVTPTQGSAIPPSGLVTPTPPGQTRPRTA